MENRILRLKCKDWLEESKVTMYLGSYDEARQKRSQRKMSTNNTKGKVNELAVRKEVPLPVQKGLEKEIADIEKQIEVLEANQVLFEQKMIVEDLSSLQGLQ
jgi:hypothetical protein